jgi:phenylacetate-coenzyme A ligase PaaK-like adenylate-forming protein
VRLEHFFCGNPYNLEALNKRKILAEILSELTQKHYKQCLPYRRILDALPKQPFLSGKIEDVPMLPVRLFKMHKFKSIPTKAVVRTLTSSGTTSQSLSRVFLDQETSLLQTRALAAIIKSFLGNERLPMILVDSPYTLKNQAILNARSVGLLGLSFFGRDHLYLLDEDMHIQWKKLNVFLEKYRKERILVFGFTFMVWQYFYQPCAQENRRLNIPRGILIHSGGWKKIQSLGVDNQQFKQKIKERLGIKNIYNFYGMVEQVGSIFMECEKAHLHVPDFADIIIRDIHNLKVLPKTKPGLVQVLSILPQSYPGHSLLTEDLGVVLGEDDCGCGRKGKYFALHGRLPAAELRGCSDTYNNTELN